MAIECCRDMCLGVGACASVFMPTRNRWLKGAALHWALPRTPSLRAMFMPVSPFACSLHFFFIWRYGFLKATCTVAFSTSLP